MKKLLLPIFAIVAISATFCLFTGCGKGGSTPEPTPPVAAKITSLSPASGTPGTIVTLTGTGFSTTAANNKVLFNGKEAAITAATSTELTVTVPADAGTGAVTVSVNGATVAAGPVFTYIEPAKITSIDKTEGAYNSIIIITGTGFGNGPDQNKVYFNGKEATVTAATATQLTVKVPLGAGTGIITLSVNGAPSITGPAFAYKLSYVISQFVGGNGAVTGFVNGDGPSARFSGIQALAFDASDNLFMVDNGNHMIRKATPSGIVSSYVGSNDFYGAAYKGSLNSHYLDYPVSLALDPTGNVYIGESFFYIEKVTAAGAYSTINLPYLGTPPNMGAASSLCSDAEGNIFATDYQNNVILKISPAGAVSVFAGSPTGAAGHANGTGSAALFDSPEAITIDKNGNLYVTDNVNQKIRKITPAGVVSDYASLAFYAINSIAVDTDGNVYVGNASYLGRSAVMKISPDMQQTKILDIYSDITGIAVNKNNELFFSGNNNVFKVAYQ